VKPRKRGGAYGVREVRERFCHSLPFPRVGVLAKARGAGRLPARRGKKTVLFLPELSPAIL
jgi:hypothetical protein